MSELRIYEETGKPVASYKTFEDIRAHLERIGVKFELRKPAARWTATPPRTR